MTEKEKTINLFKKELFGRNLQWSEELIQRMEKYDIGIKLPDGTVYAKERT